MRIEKFIEKAIKGEWKIHGYKVVRFTESASATPSFYFTCKIENKVNGMYYPTLTIYEIFLDPLAWEAVGKVEWKFFKCPQLKCNFEYDVQGKVQCPKCNYHGAKETSYQNMHNMIDALVEGKTIKEYIETL